MPAIKILKYGEEKPLVLSHYQFKNSPYEALRIVTSGSLPVNAELVGFICTQGAKYLEGGILVKANAVAITSGDGDPTDEWRPVPPEQFIYCLLIEKHMPLREICYVLVNDDGWPMISAQNPRDYIVGETDYVNRDKFTFFGAAVGNK